MLKLENTLSNNQKYKLQEKTIPEVVRIFIENKRRIAQDEKNKCLKLAKNSYDRLRCHEVYEICMKNINRSIPLLVTFYNEQKGRI